MIHSFLAVDVGVSTFVQTSINLNDEAMLLRVSYTRVPSLPDSV